MQTDKENSITEPRTDIDMGRFLDESVRLVLDDLVNTSEMVTDTLPWVVDDDT